MSPAVATINPIIIYTAAVYDPNDIVEIRRIRGKDVRSTWHSAAELPDMADTLAGDNLDGFNIYVGVNPRESRGARSDQAVTLARTVFADFDGMTVDEVMGRWDAKGLPAPTMIIASGHGVHVYLRVERPIEDLEAWRELQWDLAVYLGGDVKVKNPERVMRLPGYLNVKSEPFVACEIVSHECTRWTTFERVRELVPARPKPARPKFNGNGHAPHVSDEMKFKRCRGYLSKCRDSIDGSDGSGAMFHSCCEIFKFGLCDSDAWTMAQWFNATKCEPAWSDAEIRHKLDDAKAEVGSRFGCRLTEERPRPQAAKPRPAATAAPGPKQDPVRPRLIPIPLDSPRPPEFPDDVFAGWPGGMIEAIAEATETPRELATTFVTACIATALQGRFRINIQPGYFEPLNLWIVCALASGNRKTAGEMEAIAPLTEWEAAKCAAIEPLAEKAKSEQKTVEVRIGKLRTEAAKAKSTDDFKRMMDEITELEANPVQIPNPPQLIAQDVTVENLGTLMLHNAERMSLLSDEGGLFDLMAGLYSNGVANLDLYLQAHAGAFVRVNRGSRAPVMLKHPALTIGMSPQPEVIRGLAAHKGFRGRGLLARILYLLPTSPIGYRDGRTVEIPDDVRRSYRDGISRLLDVPERSDGLPHLLKLSEEARELWRAFWGEIELDMRPGGKLEHLNDWGGKLPGAVARIAGLLHCADFASALPNVLTVEAGTMERAIRFGKFLIGHAMIAFDMMGADASMDAARDLWKQVEKQRKAVFTVRDAWHPLRGKYAKVEYVEPGFDVLVDHGLIFEPHQADDEAPRRRGRPPSRQFQVNPVILEGWN